MKIKLYNFGKGQSLFEVIVAISISALIITTIVAVVSNSIQGSTYSRDKTLAANYIQQTMEWLKEERDVDLANLKEKINAASDSPGLFYCIDNLSWASPSTVCDDLITGTKFVRKLEFISYVNDIAHVKVTVSWQDSKGLHHVSSSTDLAIR